jgi:hypothetical protein
VYLGGCVRAFSLVLIPLALATAGSAVILPPPTPGSYIELADFRFAARPKPWRTYQASGYDRGGGFYDSGNFLREEPGRRFVMLDTAGPGVIDRMWFTRKSTREPWDLEIYLDAAARPTLRTDLDTLGAGKQEPFIAPFAGQVDLARYSYVPVGFRKHCKAVLVQTGDPTAYTYRENSSHTKIPHVYYQLTYRRLPAGSPLAAFTPDLPVEEQRARTALAKEWNATEAVPSSGLPVNLVKVPAGGRATLFEFSSTGVVRWLVMKAPSGVSVQDLRLEITFDGASSPAISSPMGTFFAAPDPRVPVKGRWLGSVGGTYYCRLPMPFHRSIRAELVSSLDQDVEVSTGARADSGSLDPTDLYLHALGYDFNQPLGSADYVPLNATGKGHWVGIVMDRPGNMEGDDHFYVDGEKEPSIHGTGTEDFFNFAWGFSHLADLPLHGATRHFGAAVLYRFHLPAGVPFTKSLKLTWEHGSGNEHQGRYSGTVFYYSDRPGAD